jgi:hypothetical protein
LINILENPIPIGRVLSETVLSLLFPLSVMFYLWQENFDPKYPKFRVLKAQKEF